MTDRPGGDGNQSSEMGSDQRNRNTHTQAGHTVLLQVRLDYGNSNNAPSSPNRTCLPLYLQQYLQSLPDQTSKSLLTHKRHPKTVLSLSIADTGFGACGS